LKKKFSLCGVVLSLFQFIVLFVHLHSSSAFDVSAATQATNPSMRASSSSTGRILYSRLFTKPSFPHYASTRRAPYAAFASGQLFSTSQLRQQQGQEQEQQRIPSNQELVQKRLEISKAKKDARQQSVEETIRRHLRIKSLIESKEKNCGEETSSDFHVPALYAVKVSVCEELRKELNLSGRERRGRVFIEVGSPATRTLKALNYDIHAFFRALRKSSFVLSGCLPAVAEDGSLLAPDNLKNSWKIETDEDVAKTFTMADELFEKDSAESLKRPSIILHLTKDPNAPPPPAPPAYLENMERPEESPTMTMISFYSFPPTGIEDPEDFAFVLRKKWKPFNALGRVYVAEEGINAQMSIPTNVLENFMQCCHSTPELGAHMENGINIDPKTFTQEEFASAGVPVNGEPSPPFRNLHVRVRNQIVADGLDKPLNWQSAGYDMPPLEWHAKLKEAKENRERQYNKPPPLILDNLYYTLRHAV